MIEIWKPVLGYEGLYSVSSLGRVRSDKKGIILKQHIRTKYLGVNLRNENGSKNFKVAKIVAMTFIGERPFGKEINHKNGIKTDNSVENLEYVSASENMRHSVRLGLNHAVKGEKHYSAKLNEKQVLEIRNLYKKGENTFVSIAKQYNVGKTVIRYIVIRRTWKHI